MGSAAALASAAVVVVLPACTVLREGGPPPPPSDPAGRPMELLEPCDGALTAVPLGSPYQGQDAALFTTTGGTTYVTVRSFPAGGLFDPEVGRAALSIGPADDPPTYDERSGVVPQALVHSAVVEDTWTAVELAPGRYWLWVTNGGDVAVGSCSPDALSDPVVATPGLAEP